MDYDLVRLGSYEFEHLTRALCSAALGPRVRVFMEESDGGRNAAIRGRIDWDGAVDGGESDSWAGYTVIQAKFRQRPGDPDSNLRWLLDELHGELSVLGTRLQRASEKPDYLLIVTNVMLSSGDGTDIDAARRMVAEIVDESALGFRAWRLWHYDTLCALLDVHKSVRLTYAGFLTTGDALARMDEWLGREQTSLGDVLTLHAIKDMLTEQFVRLGTAGDFTVNKLALYRIGIDLSALTTTFGKEGREERKVNAAKYIIDQGERILRPKAQSKPPHLLLIGGPGQGKSTVSQLVCQRYRIALLRDASVSSEVRRLLNQLAAHFDTIGLTAPSHLRWPIRVSLSDYSDYVASHPDNSLLRYLAEKVSWVSSSNITVADLQEWLGSWPWLLVLDGMDEVVSPIARERVTSGVRDFLVGAAHSTADVLLVITTRPQGYFGEFASDNYRQLLLRDLEAPEALSYAHKLTATLLAEDPDMRRQVDTLLSDATKASDTARLMRTPLQVAIMTLLLERRPRLPSDRYQLFHAYFDTIYALEADKPTELARFLQDYRVYIEAIHETIALELQQQAELMAAHEVSFPEEDLYTHAFNHMVDEGYDDQTARILVQRIMEAATRRLVLLVPRGASGVGFEIPSLQEYLAARALTRGNDSKVLENLRALVPSAHWRNTWLFAAGRLFDERKSLRADLISILREFDNDNPLSWLVRAGAQLATDLLTDDLAIRSPLYRRLLADHVLDRLNGLPDATSADLAMLLIRLAEDDRLIQQKIDQRITALLSAEGGARAHAKLILDFFLTHSYEFRGNATSYFDEHDDTAGIEDYGLRVILDGPQSVERANLGRGPKLVTYLAEYLPELATEDRTAIMRLFAALPDTNLRTTPRNSSDPLELLMLRPTPVTDYALLQEVFSRAPVADAYAYLVYSLPSRHWHVAAYLRDIVRTWYARRVTSQKS